MSEITLDVESLDSVALPMARSCTFEGLGGTIGRDDGNTLVLQDKHRRVSRLHASVTFPAGTPTITNASTSLPVHVDGQLLGYEEKMPLVQGQLLEIGPYVLRVRTTAASPGVDLGGLTRLPDIELGGGAIFDPSEGGLSPLVTPMPLSAQSAPLPASVSVDDPFAELLAGMGAGSVDPFGVMARQAAPGTAPPFYDATPQPLVDDPFAGLLDVVGGSGVVPDAGTVHQGRSSDFAKQTIQAEVPPSSSHAAWLPERPALNVIPEDFNPFDLPSETVRNSADPLAQLLGGESSQAASQEVSAEPSIDALFSSSSGTSFERQSGRYGSGSSLGEALDVFAGASENSDPLMMFGLGASNVNDLLQQPMRNDLPEISGAFQPPRPVVAASPDVKYAQSKGHVAGQGQAMQQGFGQVAGSDVLAEAFLRGAGLTPASLPSGLTPEIMAVIGSLLRTATGGAVDMLAARAATKLEVQASVTIISSQSNNPLKFSPNAEVAMQQMLGKKMPGFMRADEAMRDAFDDLRAHEIGVIAGTRAALTEILGRFDPSVLGNRLTKGSLLENLLPALRMKKLWEIYLEQYAKIRQEAEDDFQSIFGRSFLQAYERETARMKTKSTEFGNNQ